VSHLAAAVGTRSLVLFTEPLRPWLPWSHSATCLTIDPREVIATERAAIAAALARMMTMP
jgi:ADP-heptose:LPS heptosyltransferase